MAQTEPRPLPAPALAGATGAAARAPVSRTRRRLAAPELAVRAGTLALGVLVAAISLLALAAAGAPTSIVPGERTNPRFFPAWLAGPLHPIGLATSGEVRIAALLAFCAAYAVALALAARIGDRRLWAAIVLAHVAALLAPPLLSGDVFGYIGFARLAALHGLSPYAHTAAAAPRDAIYPLVGWTNATTPYGPLFTLVSEALVPLGIAGAMWALKALAAVTSLATVAVIWRTAGRLGRSRNAAIAFYGLNPLVIVFAVAGAHNDTLFGMFLAAAVLCLVSGEELRGGASLAVATALKVSAGLMLPFALVGARRRGRALAAAAAVLALAVGVGVLVYGPHLLDATQLVAEQQQVAGHSIPSQLSKLLGLGALAPGVRIAFLVLLGVVSAAMLWRAWRGSWWLDCYGFAALALLASTAWLWPWYGLWALLPASLSASRRLRAGALAASAYLVAISVLVSAPLSAR